MKPALLNISAACILCLFAHRVAAQSTLPLAPILTHYEQARLLGLLTSKSEATPLLFNESASHHVAKAKSLLNQMESLKSDGTRSGNPLLRKVEFHLEKARLAGFSYESALNRIYSESQTAPALIQPRKQALRTVMKTDQQLGLLTPENLQRLEAGRATVVTRGNPKYLGEITEVDHRIPIRGPNGRAIYENEVANLQVLPKSINREKWANVNEISKAHEAKLDRAYWANKYAVAGGALSTGAGVVLLYASTRGLFDAFQSDVDYSTTNLRIGEQGSLLVAGGGFTASGLAQLGSRFTTTETTLAKLGSVTKWCGRVGIVGVILGEGIGIGVDYYNWDEMTARQKAMSKVQHSVSIGGMIVAFGAGCLLGIETGPGALVFGTAAAGATYAAAKVATWMVEDSYNRLDDAQKEQVCAFIYQHYGVSE